MLLVLERQSGPVYYAKWRDSTKTQVMKRLGPAWVERHGDVWRKRRGTLPDGHLVPSVAAERMREVIDAHEEENAAVVADRAAGVKDRREVTYGDAAEEWWAFGRDVLGWKPATVRDRRSTLRVHLLPAFGAMPLREFTRDRDAVRAWWAGMHDLEREGGRLSDRNTNKLLAELRASMTWARDHYRLEGDPTTGIRKHAERSTEQADFYSVEEVEALVRAAASERDALTYRVAAYTGMRRGELVSLRWNRLDYVRATLHVVDNVSAGQDARVKDGEGRTVPLIPQLAELLAAWRPDDARDDDLVFPGTLPGRKLDGDALSKRYRKARDAANLRSLTYHELRHTFGSLAVDKGASIVQVQAWMGHSDVKTTMRYLHTKSRIADAELLGGAFTADALELVIPIEVASTVED